MDETRVACAISEIRKNIMLNSEVLTNKTAQCAVDMALRERREERFETDFLIEGFAIADLRLKQKMDLKETPTSSGDQYRRSKCRKASQFRPI